MQQGQEPFEIHRGYWVVPRFGRGTILPPEATAFRGDRGPDLTGAPDRRDLSSGRGLCTGDFLRAVTNRPEDSVGFSVRRSTKEGIQIFPDNFPISGYFEKTSEGGFV